MEECIFCQIAQNKSPAEIEYEDPEVIGFWDVRPKAPTHILIIPKKHISSISKAKEEDQALLGRMLLAAKSIAEKKNLNEMGYRLVINEGDNAGAVVDHLHLHLLGGKALPDLA